MEMLNIKQMQQIMNFLSAYPFDVVEAGIAAWINGEIPKGMEDKKQSEETIKIMPFCKCGKQLKFIEVCPGCAKGKEGYKSKFICGCGYEEYFKETVREKIEELTKREVVK